MLSRHGKWVHYASTCPKHELRNNFHLRGEPEQTRLYEKLACRKGNSENSHFPGNLENILMMKMYFERVYENDKARSNELVSSGCFTFKFVSQLLLMIPAEELMQTNRLIMGMDHTDQIKLYLKYAQTRLQSLYSLRNLNTTEQVLNNPAPSGPSAHSATNVSKNELKRIKNQLRAEILAEQKLPVMLTGQNAPIGSSFTKNQNTPQSGQNSKNGNFNKNALELDGKSMNEKILNLFSLIYSGKQIKAIPTLKDNNGQVPESLNFEDCSNLITHGDISNNQLKQALVFCMGHREGCLICLHIVNKTGLKNKVFPHLRETSYNGPFYVTNGSMRCPNLMRMNREGSISILDQIPEICKTWFKRTVMVQCNVCTRYPPKTCTSSKQHFMLCNCSICVQKTERIIHSYEKLIGGGNAVISSLKINSSLITGLCVKLNDLSDDLSQLPNGPPLFQE